MAEKEKAQKTEKREPKVAGGSPKPGKPGTGRGPAKISGVENPDVKPKGYIPRMKTHCKDSVVPELMKAHEFSNPFQCPRMVKVVVNVGVSEAKDNIQALDVAREELTAITGQLPEVRRAKKSISNFKLRQGMPIGLRVTLRNDRMWEFLDRLISVAVPRIRDFHGLDASGFDGRGNYNLGLKEQLIFPEIDLEKTNKMRGMNITFVTTAGTDDLGREFLSLLGFPFRRPKGAEKKPVPVLAAAAA